MQDRLRILQSAKQAVKYAQLNPFGSDLGQATEMYASLRMPQLAPMLLRNDRSSPEWDMAIRELWELCARSGYRTDDLPSAAEQMARAMTSEMASAETTPLPPAPSAAELKMIDELHHESVRVDQARQVIDDRRGARPQPAPPQPTYRDVPRLRDMIR